MTERKNVENFEASGIMVEASDKLSEIELGKMWFEETQEAIDFYNRFTYRMRMMMELCKEAGMVLFLGP